jgi:hypothetical protein
MINTTRSLAERFNTTCIGTAETMVAGSGDIKKLHVTPGQWAGDALRQAIQEAERDDEVLSFCDDLSCGPIDPDDPMVRAACGRQLNMRQG